MHHQSLDETPDFLWGDTCLKSTTDKPTTPIVDFDEQVLPRVKCAANLRISRIHKHSAVEVYLHDLMLVLLFLTFMLVAFL